jgi:hypothetical protein
VIASVSLPCSTSLFKSVVIFADVCTKFDMKHLMPIDLDKALCRSDFVIQKWLQARLSVLVHTCK